VRRHGHGLEPMIDRDQPRSIVRNGTTAAMAVTAHDLVMRLKLVAGTSRMRRDRTRRGSSVSAGEAALPPVPGSARSEAPSSAARQAQSTASAILMPRRASKHNGPLAPSGAARVAKFAHLAQKRASAGEATSGASGARRAGVLGSATIDLGRRRGAARRGAARATSPPADCEVVTSGAQSRRARRPFLRPRAPEKFRIQNMSVFRACTDK
jgi:hypothetical protein